MDHKRCLITPSCRCRNGCGGHIDSGESRTHDSRIKFVICHQLALFPVKQDGVCEDWTPSLRCKTLIPATPCTRAKTKYSRGDLALTQALAPAPCEIRALRTPVTEFLALHYLARRMSRIPAAYAVQEAFILLIREERPFLLRKPHYV